MRVLSVNVGRARTHRWDGAEVTTAIFKSPIEGRVAVGELGLEGDEQANPKVHGGPYKAVYAYAIEDLRDLGELAGLSLGPGGVGENLTLEGVDIAGAEVGERWRVGRALFRVTLPRSPCKKLNLRTGTASFGRTFVEARRFGAYLQVLEEGDVAAGDPVEIVRRPGHGLTVTEVFDIVTAGGSRASDLLVARDDLPAPLLEFVLTHVR